MKSKHTFLLFLILIAWVIGIPLKAENAVESKGLILAISDGNARIDLLWLPPLGKWPAGGWQLQDRRGNILAERIQLGEPSALEGLSAEDREAIEQVKKSLFDLKEMEQLRISYGLLAIRAFASPDFSRALGISRNLNGVSPGLKQYRVLGLDRSGKPTGLVLESASVDASRKTPLLPVPEKLREKFTLKAVELFWENSPINPDLPAYGYAVERTDSSGKRKLLTPIPLMLNDSRDSKEPAFLDSDPPVEQKLTYSVYQVDLFGRRSLPAEISFFLPDLKALLPPEAVKAEAKAGKVVLTWEPNQNPSTASVVVERAYHRNGPFEVLTRQGLNRDVRLYTDDRTRGGTTYYYRLRSAGPRGDLGDPSPPVFAEARNVSAPPQPSGLKAVAGRTRISITWDGDKFPVAGYLIERKIGDQDWTRINNLILQQTAYDDQYTSEAGGTFFYRVTAIAFDRQKSKPSVSLKVELPDLSLPPVPRITRIESINGKAVIYFKPGMPEEKTREIIVLRASTDIGPGLVMGKPVPVAAEKFIDSLVSPGCTYWYRVTALDRSGNRSELSDPVVVFIGNPDIPVPEPPKVKWVSKPFPHVMINFSPPPENFLVVIQRKSEDESDWSFLSGPLSTAEAMDPNPPVTGKIYYRIIYQSQAGAQGKASMTAEISR